MKPKLIAIFLLLVLMPLILLGWLGWRITRAEQQMVQQRFRELLVAKLGDVDATIANVLAACERDLLRATDLTSYDTAVLRELTGKHPLARQIFVLDPKGKRLHPPTTEPLSVAEQEFLDRAGQVWKDKQIFYRQPEANAAARTHGWYTWYWGAGLNLILWRRDNTGNVVGIELDRARLLADIIVRLPQSTDLPNDRITLSDSTGAVVYQWGEYAGTQPLATIALREPLQTWHLAYFAPATPRGSLIWTLLVTLLAVALALTGLAIYFYRENTRQIREAAQRVSFVNQVSHELKTPLTNIRMYAELLQDSLPEHNRHISVIVSESQRLSRLIANVLRFARPHTLHKTASQVDAVIRSVIEDFTPAFTAKGIAINFTAHSPAPVSFDADALQQIIGNLFSNVEKYAAAGQRLDVTSQQTDGVTLVTVADHGPGIPADQRDNIFKPFHRLSNKLTDGVTGTGIGLTIARDLARQHGGDLILLPTETGAAFQLRLPS